MTHQNGDDHQINHTEFGNGDHKCKRNAPLKSIVKYFQQNAMLATKPIRLRHKTVKVYATKAIFCRALDDSLAEHIESHVIIRRVVANGCIFAWIILFDAIFQTILNTFTVFTIMKLICRPN